MMIQSIADVKRAAENISASGCAFLSDPVSRDASILSEFALSVLNAPGLSAERLAEIQQKEQAASDGPWESHPDQTTVRGANTLDSDTGRQIAGDVYCQKQYSRLVAPDASPQADADLMFAADARQAVPELLSEVLRLRAELATRMPLETARITMPDNPVPVVFSAKDAIK